MGVNIWEPMKYKEVHSAAQVGQLLSDEKWVAEQKMDGTRVQVRIEAGTVTFWTGRTALKHTAALQWCPALREQLLMLRSHPGDRIVLDGELMIDCGEYRIFDVIEYRNGQTGVYRVEPGETVWLMRKAALESLWNAKEVKPAGVRVVRSYRKEMRKRSLLQTVTEQGSEGVVFKRIDGLYQPGERVDHVLKYKLVKTADVIVTQVNRPDAKHGSATLAVIGDEGEAVPVGKCSLIGKPQVAAGDVIECTYLYWSGERMVQPRMTGVRDDKQPGECDLAQFPAYSREEVALP